MDKVFRVKLADGQHAVINAFPVGDLHDALSILTKQRSGHQIGVISSDGQRRMLPTTELGLDTAEGRTVFLQMNSSG